MVDFDKVMRVAELALKFGEVDRATQHPDGRPESDATHTIMLGLLGLEFGPPGLDPGAIVINAMVHDLVEFAALDTCTAWGLSKAEAEAKEAREARALVKIKEMGLERIWGLISDYEQQATPEARWVRYVDKACPKLTHLHNMGRALRAIGMTTETMERKHVEQGAALAERYPEQEHARALFEAACRACEERLTDLDCPDCGGEQLAAVEGGEGPCPRCAAPARPHTPHVLARMVVVGPPDDEGTAVHGWTEGGNEYVLAEFPIIASNWGTGTTVVVYAPGQEPAPGSELRGDESARHAFGWALGLHSDCDPPLSWAELHPVLGEIGDQLRRAQWAWRGEGERSYSMPADRREAWLEPARREKAQRIRAERAEHHLGEALAKLSEMARREQDHAIAEALLELATPRRPESCRVRVKMPGLDPCKLGTSGCVEKHEHEHPPFRGRLTPTPDLDDDDLPF